MNRLRWKLLAAMIALVVLTIGLSGLFTRRITHDQVRRLLVARGTMLFEESVKPIEEHIRGRGAWQGVDAIIQRVSATAQRPIVLTDLRGNVIAVSHALRKSNVKVDGENRLSATGFREGRFERLVVRMPPVSIRDSAGRAVANVYFFPPDQAGDGIAVREIAAVDRRLIIVFTVAALVALVLTFFISRRITKPIEQLTLAVQEMARGEIPAPLSVTGRDEIAQLAMSFNAMAGTISSQQELRRRMIGDVAHELRTPLTNLRCELEAIQDGLTRPDTARIASVHEEVLHLQRLVEDLQELAVAEAGALQFNIDRIDLGFTIVRVVGSQADVTAEDAVFVNADVTRIRQIMQNLLTNAMNHTPDGEPVHVGVTRDAGNAIVSVRDRGPGVAVGDLERIFERFYRIDESRGREGGGAGLGLAIVRRLVELHGGRIWAESLEGQGATFTFTIPLARS